MLTISVGNRGITVWLGLALLFLPMLPGCSTPDRERISQDFERISAKEMGAGVQAKITLVSPGEGDSENVYQHIKFDVAADVNIAPENGWLAGMTLIKGQRLYNGEVVMLYQRTGRTEWVLARYNLARPPGQNH